MELFTEQQSAAPNKAPLNVELLLKGFIEKAKTGKIFTVTFIKRNGQIRTLTGRLNVKKHLKGGNLAYSPTKRGLLPVFDMQKKAYRMINFNTLLSAQVEGDKLIILRPLKHIEVRF